MIKLTQNGVYLVDGKADAYTIRNESTYDSVVVSVSKK